MCDHCGCRVHRPIADLTAEHVEILALAASLAEATRHGRRVDQRVRGTLVDLLHLHVAKEEGGLYPLLAAEMGRPADTYADLEEEHRELFAAIDDNVFDHLALYALQRHIEEEEEVLFSGALFHFEGDTWDELEAVHHRIDDLAAAGERV
jgi:hemerythrin-like domain-containing protein